VTDNLPSVTVLIPSPPDLADVQAVAAARALDYPADKLEILVVRGRQPSVQRNAGMKAARGDLIYFLDNDSVAPPESLRRAVPHFADAKVKIVGGPNLCPPDAPELEQIFALVLGSFALASSRARYTSVGQVRATGEKELILCNLLARRDTMLELGGFNEALYPNEENALMDAIQKRGDKLLYDPELIVHRRPRKSMKSFARMLMNYGRGRAEQFREYPTFGSVLNFVPPLFLVYLVVVLPAVFFLTPFALVPLGLYAVAVVLQVLALMPRGGVARSLGALPFIVMTHVLYGFGFWRGLFTKLETPGEKVTVPVTIEKITK
jgi:cellulose synthase/poly-beta-1,6-N-acetylglucosamine synthase-like glycosyltransferase